MMSLQPVKNLIYILCIVLIGLITNPYSFGHSNHGQELPPILAIIDNSLYSNDFAVQSYLEINPRYFWQNLIAAFNNIFGLSISQSLAFIQLFSTISFFTALFFITLYLFKEKYQVSKNQLTFFGGYSYISFLAMMPLLSWGSKIFYFDGAPSTLGIGIAIWSFYFALNKKFFLAYLFCSLTIPIHFLIGIFVGLVILPFYFYSVLKERNFFNLIINILIWLIPAFYIYISMLALESDPIYSYKLFDVFGLFRVPHHWVPSLGSFLEWTNDLILLFIAIFCIYKLNKNEINKQSLILFSSILAVSIIGIGLNFLFVEVFQSEFIGKLQFQRIMPFGHLAVFFLIVLYIFNTKHNSIQQRLISVSIIVYPLTTTILANSEKLFQTLSALFAVTLILVLLNLFVYSYKKNHLRYELGGLAIISLITYSFYFKPESLNLIENSFLEKVSISASNYYNFFENGNHQSEIATWLKDNTNENDQILIPPLGTYFLSILQFQSQRGVYFSHKNVPYTKNAIFEWAYRAENLLNQKLQPFMSDLQLLESWKNNPREKIESIAKINNICYLIDIKEANRRFAGEIIMSEHEENNEYILWKLNYCNRV